MKMNLGFDVGVFMRLNVLLYCVASLLACVTAVSVSIGVYALVENKGFALLFAFAAVLLDLFKCLAWSVLPKLRSIVTIGGIAVSAVVLGVVSGWATYDRLMSSILDSQSQVKALSEQRASFLESRVASDKALITRLDSEAESVRKQAAGLRSTGVVSKALSYEESSHARISKERDSAIERMNQDSSEIARIQSVNGKASTISPGFSRLLCFGFSLALEIVPALILLSLRDLSKSRVSDDFSEAQPTQSFQSEDFLEKPDFSRSDDLLETQKIVETAPSTNDEFLVSLLKDLSVLETGTPVPLKEFAKNNRIGNLRAGVVFKAAVAEGRLRKTTIGYVVA
ncbi:hypothetical protein [Pseudomonas putida]|uniref:hypothetical protein n=1 Tax=Pseudomonas putida TaxID=303 RepID=UPI003466967D